MRRSMLDAKLTNFCTPRPLVETSHPLESSHLYQLAQVGYKEARLLVFILKQTGSKSMIAPGFMLAIPLSRIKVCFLLFRHFACPLKPAVWVGFLFKLFSGVKSRLQIILDMKRVSFPSYPWFLKYRTH